MFSTLRVSARRCYPYLSHQTRCISIHSRPLARPSYKRVGTILAVSAGATALFIDQTHADKDTEPERVRETRSMGSLLRSYVVFSLCSIPSLVDMSPKLLEVLTSIPVISHITEAVVRHTFFYQFVGGETAESTFPLVQSLRDGNKGVLFAYSVEVSESEAAGSATTSKMNRDHISQQIVDEMIHSVDVAANFEERIADGPANGRKTWVAVKMTALVPDAQALINFSDFLIRNRPSQNVPFPGCPTTHDIAYLHSPKAASTLRKEDIESIHRLHKDLRRICTRAQERGIKIIIDAEHSWYQPAIDALQLALMEEYNALNSSRGRNPIQPLVYGTYQAYLRRTPAYLAQSIAHARSNNYALGIKLVRGAYHPHELAAHSRKSAGQSSTSISNDEHPPVWALKSETDKCFNECAALLISSIAQDVRPSHSWGWGKRQPVCPTIGVLFGTHNRESCHLILDKLVEAGLARRYNGLISVGDETVERLTFGQLYGMSDNLTDFLATTTTSNYPLVMKYLPYGALSEVMPYLSRRAIENKSILGEGGATEERKRAWAGLKERVLGR